MVVVVVDDLDRRWSLLYSYYAAMKMLWHSSCHQTKVVVAEVVVARVLPSACTAVVLVVVLVAAAVAAPPTAVLVVDVVVVVVGRCRCRYHLHLASFECCCPLSSSVRLLHFGTLHPLLQSNWVCMLIQVYCWGL